MIEDIFYKEIIPECSSKKLIIGDFSPTIFFDVKIVEENITPSLKDEVNPKPIIVINNKDGIFYNDFCNELYDNKSRRK